jgi:branched-chain amino acid transport system ATP-binding protein
MESLTTRPSSLDPGREAMLPDPTAPVLSVEGVSVRFGGVRALSDLSVQAAAGVVTGLIGPNGAGKTTLFDVITGVTRPQQGSVKLWGDDITLVRPHMRARLGIGRTFQALELFPSLTMLDNVRVAVESLGRGRGARGRRGSAKEARAILERLGIEMFADRAAGSLPTGILRLLDVGRALARKPQLLLLDEPSSGLNQSETEGLAEVLRELARGGMAVVLVEHDMKLVMSVCSVIQVLEFGRVIAVGSPEEVRSHPQVLRAYLGGSAA